MTALAAPKVGLSFGAGQPSYQWAFDYFLTRTWSRYFLSTCCRAAMRQSAARNRAALACIDLPQSSYADGISIADATVPSWFLATYPGNNVFICLGGTYTPAQWYGHLVGLPMATSNYYPGAVNSFWKLTAENLALRVQAALGSVTGPLNFYVTGHSWGGATGLILAYYLAHAYAGSTFQVVSFGAPKVGNQAFADGLNAYVNQDQNTQDPICALPPYMNVAVRFLALGGAGAVFNAPQNYVMAGTQSRWLGGPNTGSVASFLRTGNEALSALLLATPAMRAHQLYHYVKHYFLESGGLNTASGSGALEAANYGYDLGALLALNAQLSVDESLVVSPAFPVPASAEP